MNELPLTPQVLRDHGFVEKMRNGHLFFVKNNVAITYTYGWKPCTLDFGEPLCQLEPLNTWEELERLMQEGGVIPHVVNGGRTTNYS